MLAVGRWRCKHERPPGFRSRDQTLLRQTLDLFALEVGIIQDQFQDGLPVFELPNVSRLE